MVSWVEHLLTPNKPREGPCLQEGNPAKYHSGRDPTPKHPAEEAEDQTVDGPVPGPLRLLPAVRVHEAGTHPRQVPTSHPVAQDAERQADRSTSSPPLRVMRAR